MENNTKPCYCNFRPKNKLFSQISAFWKIHHNCLEIAFLILLIVLNICSFAQEQKLPWWHQYTTISTDPEFKSLNEIRVINAETWRAAGWFGGFYGFWFGDMLENHTDVPNRWNRVIEAGSKPMMYYEAGEVGDFVTLIDEEKKELLLEGWHWHKWTGQEGYVHWYGLEAFMNNVPWAPYPTADDYGLSAFTYPDGRAIPAGKLYDVLAKRYHNDSWAFMEFTNPDITDEMAQKTGLANISHKQHMAPDVQQGSGWVIGRLISQDHTNPQLLKYQCQEIAYSIKRYKPWGVHIDNFGATDIYPSHQNSFGIWAVHTFREFLKDRFTPEQLAELGVKSVETFDIREYTASAYAEPGRSNKIRLRDPRWMDDVIFRAHLIHKTEKGIHYWQEIYKSAKNAYRSLGLNNPVFGNVMPPLPGCGFMKGICDIAHFEWKTEGTYPAMPEMGLPPKARVAYVSRLGENLSEASYCWPSLYVPKKYKGKAYENLHKVLAFDCFANRGILDYNHWFLDNYSPGSNESAGYINTFIRSVADELSGRKYLADIGLVYCPWSNLASMNAAGLQPEIYLNEYKGWCDYLINTHAQWDLILSEDISADSLKYFKVIILPSMLVVTPKQLTAFKIYLKGGGRIIATGETGAFYGPDNFLVHRPVNILDQIGDFSKLILTKDRPGGVYYSSKNEKIDGLGRLIDTCKFHPSLRTDASSDIGVNASLRENARKSVLTIDLNNYTYDLINDTINQAKTCRVSIDLPEVFIKQPLKIGCADPEQKNDIVWENLPSEKWQLDAKDDVLHIDVPSFKYYLIISIKISDYQ